MLLPFKSIRFRSIIIKARDEQGYTVLNGYRMLKELGSGAEYTVRLGKSVLTGERVAIYSQPVTDSRIGFNKHAERFNHFRLLDKLNQHSIPGTRRVLELWYCQWTYVQLHDMLLSTGTPIYGGTDDTAAECEKTHQGDCDSTACRYFFLVLEYCDGEGVFSLVGQLYYSEYIMLSKHLAQTIHQLHRINIVHKDIKMENILLSKKPLANDQGCGSSDATLGSRVGINTNLVYLIDFGISIDLDEIKTQALTVFTMLDRLSGMIQKDLGKVVVREWFDAEGLEYGLLTSNCHIAKVIGIIVHYLEKLFLQEDIRILADPLTLEGTKFITNKRGTIAYSPPEVKLISFSDSIVDCPRTSVLPFSSGRSTPVTVRQINAANAPNVRGTRTAAADTHLTDTIGSAFSDAASSPTHVLVKTDSPSRQFSGSEHMAAQAALVVKTISHSASACHATCEEKFRSISATFKDKSLSDSVYAVLPTCIDVWCFGVTMLYLLIGVVRVEPLYRRGNDVLAISHHLTPFTTDLLCGCLAPDPVERYTADDIFRHPIYIGYRVSYEEDDLTTYIVSAEQYRSHFGLEQYSASGASPEMDRTGSTCSDQIAGNALENYHQYIMRCRRKTLIKNGRQHIRRASISSLSIVSHEHVFKESYTDDTLLDTVKLRRVELFADPWINPIVLSLDLAAISLLNRNESVRYLYPQDYPDTNSYFIPKFFDIRRTLGESKTIGQGLLYIKLKALNYLATRLLGTVVYHNSLTDFKKHIMPEHIRGYTVKGDLGFRAENMSPSWARYRKRWGTRTSRKDHVCSSALMMPHDYPSSLLTSSQESSSDSRFSPIILRNSLLMSKISECKAPTTPERSVHVFDEALIDYLAECSNESHEIDGSTDTIAATEPSSGLDHSASSATENVTLNVSLSSCELLAHNSQFLDSTLVSHDFVARRESLMNLNRKQQLPNQEDLAINPKAQTASDKDDSVEDQWSIYQLTIGDIQQESTGSDTEQTDTLLKAQATRVLTLHSSYTKKTPLYIPKEFIVKAGLSYTDASKSQTLGAAQYSEMCSKPAKILEENLGFSGPSLSNVSKDTYIGTDIAHFTSLSHIDNIHNVSNEPSRSATPPDMAAEMLGEEHICERFKHYKLCDDTEENVSSEVDLELAVLKQQLPLSVQTKMPDTLPSARSTHNSLTISSSSNDKGHKSRVRVVRDQRPAFANRNKRILTPKQKTGALLVPLASAWTSHDDSTSTGTADCDKDSGDAHTYADKSARLDNKIKHKPKLSPKELAHSRLYNAIRAELFGSFSNYWKTVCSITRVPVKNTRRWRYSKHSRLKRTQQEAVREVVHEHTTKLYEASQGPSLIYHRCPGSELFQLQAVTVSNSIAPLQTSESNTHVSEIHSGSFPKQLLWKDRDSGSSKRRSPLPLCLDHPISMDKDMVPATADGKVANMTVIVCNAVPSGESDEAAATATATTVAQPSPVGCLFNSLNRMGCLSHSSSVLSRSILSQIPLINKELRQTSISSMPEVSFTNLCSIPNGQSKCADARQTKNIAQLSPYKVQKHKHSRNDLAAASDSEYESLTASITDTNTWRDTINVSLHPRDVDKFKQNIKEPATKNKKEKQHTQCLTSLFCNEFHCNTRTEVSVLLQSKQELSQPSMTSTMSVSIEESREESQESSAKYKRCALDVAKDNAHDTGNVDNNKDCTETSAVLSSLYRSKTLSTLVKKMSIADFSNSNQDLQDKQSTDSGQKSQRNNGAYSVTSSKSSEGAKQKAEPTGLHGSKSAQDAHLLQRPRLLNRHPSFHTFGCTVSLIDGKKPASARPPLPLIPTRQLGPIEQAFLNKESETPDRSKLVSLRRYDADNLKLKKAASYLRNLRSSNLSREEANTIRVSTHEHSETNNDDDTDDGRVSVGGGSRRSLEAGSLGFSKGIRSFPSNTSSFSSLDVPLDDSCVFATDIGERIAECDLKNRSKTNSSLSLVIDAGQPDKRVSTDDTKEKEAYLPNSFTYSDNTRDSNVCTDKLLSSFKQQTSESFRLISKDGFDKTDKQRQSNFAISIKINASDGGSDSSTVDTNYTVTSTSISTIDGGDDNNDNSYSNTALMSNAQATSSTMIDANNPSELTLQQNTQFIESMMSAHPVIDVSSTKRMDVLGASPNNTPMSFDKPLGTWSAVPCKQEKKRLIDNSLVDYVKSLPRFLNKFFSFSLTQAILSSAATSHSSLSGLLFAHYYTHMRPYVFESLTGLNIYNCKEMSEEYEISINMDNTKETSSSSFNKSVVMKVVPSTNKTMSANKVLRPAQISCKAPKIEQVTDLDVKVFDDLFVGVFADEESHVLELEHHEKHYEDNEFSIEEYTCENATSTTL